MSYMKHLRPVLIQASAVSGIMTCGDIISQTLIEKQEYSLKRTIKFAGLGFIVLGPTLYFWYLKLEKLVPPNKNTIQRGIHKMLYDQIIFAPIINFVLSGIFGILNGDDSQRFKKRFTHDYPDIMTKNYILWPAAQTINFAFVPMQFQVIYNQSVALLWNCYMSLILNKK